MGTEVKRLDFDCRREKKGYGAYCFHSRNLSLRRRRGGGLCWFRQHKEGLKLFEGIKSVHRETSSNGKLPVMHGHSATPMETTNQVQEGIKGYNVGGYFWNPVFCAQSKAEWIRVGISDSSYIPAYCGFGLESYKVTVVGIAEQRHYQPPFPETGPWLSSSQPVTVWLLEERLSHVDQESGQPQTPAEIQLFKVRRSVTLLHRPKSCTVTRSLGHMWTNLKAEGQVSL